MHSAQLVWITPNAEQLIGKIARVSNPNNEDNPNVDKLLRYLQSSGAIPTDSLATVLPKLRRQDTKNRQNSIDDLPAETKEYYKQRIDDHFRQGVELYESLLHSDVAKECARSVLPLNTVTRLYMSGTIRSWLHYVDLRADNGTQREHMQVAASIGEILDTKLPTISRAMWG